MVYVNYTLIGKTKHNVTRKSAWHVKCALCLAGAVLLLTPCRGPLQGSHPEDSVWAFLLTCR